MDIKKSVIAGVSAGCLSGIIFIAINTVSSKFSFLFDYPILSFVVFEVSCAVIGLLLGVLYLILDNKKIHKNQRVNNLINFSIIFLLFLFGIIILSYKIFNYPELISSTVSVISYCCFLELILRKFKWGGLENLFGGAL